LKPERELVAVLKPRAWIAAKHKLGQVVGVGSLTASKDVPSYLCYRKALSSGQFEPEGVALAMR
jgi:hypothetical protein